VILDRLLRTPGRSDVLPGQGHSASVVGAGQFSQAADRLLNSPLGRAAVAVSPVLAMAVAVPLLPVFKPYFTGFAAAIILAVALLISVLASRIPVAWSLGLILLLAPLEPPIRISQSYVVGFGVDVLTVSVFVLIVTELVARGSVRRRTLMDLPKPLLFLLMLATAAMLSAVTAVFVHNIDIALDEPVFVARLVKYGLVFAICGSQLSNISFEISHYHRGRWLCIERNHWLHLFPRPTGVSELADRDFSQSL
jgi:hypothetical protein